MRSKSYLLRRAAIASVLGNALLCAGDLDAAAKARTTRKTPVTPPPASVAVDPGGLSEPPASTLLRERVRWANQEADRLRAIVSGAPKDERARTLMASLAVVVSADLERSLAVGDTDTAAAFRHVIARKLSDTRWRLGWIGRHGAGGGHFALGVMALHGIAEPRDRETACPLFSSAWENGFADAAYRLSECVGAKEPTRETALLLAAAGAGHATANEKLGRRCLESKPPDAKCAFTRLSGAAAAGRPSAKSLLGWMYAQGVGVDADPKHARDLYAEAAKAGDLSAANNLGELHETGRGVRVDPSEAALYYREAAEAGFAPAQFNLGRLYATGSGVARDVELARKWLKASQKGGIQASQKLLDWLDAQETQAR